MDTRPTVGLIGTGRMGGAIGERLLDQGVRLVVWNRTTEKAAPLIARGAFGVRTPVGVVQQAAVTLVMVSDARAMDEVYHGPSGLLATSLDGRSLVDMTTASVDATRQAGAAVASRGGRFVDAPVSGSIDPARAGTLVILAGGDASAIETVRPILEKLSRKLVHVGPLGSGVAMKLALNLPLAVYWVTLGEALAVAQGYGIELVEALALIGDSKAAIGALPFKLSAILGETTRVEFDVNGMHKDLRAMLRSAEDIGIPLPTVAAAAEATRAAADAGWGERDLASIVRFISGLPPHA